MNIPTRTEKRISHLSYAPDGAVRFADFDGRPVLLNYGIEGDLDGMKIILTFYASPRDYAAVRTNLGDDQIPIVDPKYRHEPPPRTRKRRYPDPRGRN